MRKSLNVSPAAEPIRTFGGSPINVAVPPTLDRNASPISNGTGLILRCAATMMVTGASRRMTVALLKSMEMTVVTPPKMAAAHLKINPVPLLMGEAFLSNVGGTATLIGDPPNVLIGSAAGLTFNDFLIVLLPVVLVAYYPTLWTIRRLFAAELQKRAGLSADLLPSRPRDSIKDRAGLTKLLVVLG